MLLLLAGTGSNGRECARRLLEKGLEEAFHLRHLPRRLLGRWGKPFFPDLPEVHFNLSHSGDLAFCAISDEPVGVDIERIRPRGEGLPRYALTEEEYRWYEEHGGDWGAFYTLWTRKESWCKRTGGSAARPKLLTPPLPGSKDPLAPRSFAGEGWRCAVCPWKERAEIRWLGEMGKG